jgi:hypothetical protein
MECYSMKLELLTNATVVSDAIRFVAEQSKEKMKLSSSNKEGFKEPNNKEELKANQQTDKNNDDFPIIMVTFPNVKEAQQSSENDKNRFQLSGTIDRMFGYFVFKVNYLVSA